MHTSELAFITQTRRDLGDSRLAIMMIEAGIHRPHRDGADITQEALTDLRRRERDASAILARYA